jgi:hypothetical protein
LRGTERAKVRITFLSIATGSPEIKKCKEIQEIAWLREMSVVRALTVTYQWN